MLSNQISPSDTQIAELKAFPQNTPLIMLNILKFKSKTSTNETGQEVYARYFKNASPFVEKVGAKLIWKGQVHNTVIGNPDNQPHVVFLVEYPSVNHFFTMVSNPEYQKIAGGSNYSFRVWWFNCLSKCTIMETIRTHYRTCNLCKAMCGLEITYQDKTILSIKGDKKDALSKGHICPKAIALQDLYHDKDRLKTPIKRTENGWIDISWAEAYDEVADNIKFIQNKYGKNPSLRIFENFCHYTFGTFAIHTGKHTIPKSQEIFLLPTDKGEVNFRTFIHSFFILLSKREIRTT